MANRETNVTNAAETTLSSALSAGATTINVTDTASFPAVPFYAVIDPDVDASREIVLVDSSKTATTFVLSGAAQRGQDGTTDIAHSLGAKVVCVPIAALWTDVNDRVDAAVSLTGAQTITGAKTFSVDPTLADGSSALSQAEGNAAFLSSTAVAAKAFNSVAQSIANATTTVLAFDSETYDSNDLHDTVTNNSRLTAPAGKDGRYRVLGQVQFAPNSTGIRQLILRKNGITDVAYVNANALTDAVIPHREMTATEITLVAGDYVELLVYQSSGGALNVSAGSGVTYLAASLIGA